MEASFASVKLLLVANLIYIMLMFLTMMLFNMNK
jgi:ABC-type amino acid transport system permease subunit